MFAEMETVIDRAAASVDVRGLRMALRDVAEWVRELPVTQRHGVNTALEHKFGQTLDEIHRGHGSRPEDILERGKIRNAGEYRVLSQWAEEIYSDPSRKSELDSTNRLLAGYHAL
jgi:hypothetical protein